MASSPWTFALITLLIAVGTLALRAVFILLAGNRELSPRLLRSLSFVPATVFCALVVTTMHLERLRVPGDHTLLRVAALLTASIVAFRTRSILWTIVSGMASLWLFHWLARLF